MLQFPLRLVHLLELHLLQLIEDDLVFLPILHIERHMKIVVPVARIEAPVAGVILELAMHMTHEFLRREPAVALQALDAGRFLIGVHVRRADTLAFAKALVIHVEAEGTLGQTLDRHIAIPVGAMKQGGTEAFRIGSGDQATGLDIGWQDLGGLELHQLIVRALRTVDAQLIEDPVDLLQREVVENIVEKLWQAQSHLAAHGEASNCLALQFRLVQLSTSRICHR